MNLDRQDKIERRDCESCAWWIGWAGKTSDFGWYAPCVRDESPHRMKVTQCAHSCRFHQTIEELARADKAPYKAMDYMHLDLRPSAPAIPEDPTP